MLVHMEDGHPVRVEGDPAHPINRGALCPNGAAALEYLESPLRLRYPLVRKGARGAGEWEQVSWNKALDKVAAGLLDARDR